MQRLYVAISHHGLGHLAQTAPVLNALAAQAPGVEIVVRSALAAEALAARLVMPFRHLPVASDCNLVMHDALRADLPASLDAYRRFHQDWPRRVEAEARELDALGVDAVFSNVGYLPLAAAHRAGLPAWAMCSLNWADIARHYLGQFPEMVPILDQMIEAYAGARAFLRPTPAMPMPALDNTVAIPPVVQSGRPQRGELLDRLGLAAGTKLILVGMGGIRYRPPVERWPCLPGPVFLVPDDWRADHPCTRALRETGLPFRDVLASSDALITKPGYGSYVEAVAAGVPVLTIPRRDWPESVCLNDWLARHARMQEIDEQVLITGELDAPLAALWSLPAKPPVVCDGAEVAARRLLSA